MVRKQKHSISVAALAIFSKRFSVAAWLVEQERPGGMPHG
jgi:hypothetical protein